MNRESLAKLKSLKINEVDEEEDVIEEDDDVSISDDDVSISDDDVSISDDDVAEEEPVILGFVQKPNNKWSILRHLFPSKAGNVPAWLNPVNLPSGKSRQCDVCGEPLQFLIQVYAPLSEKQFAFHRTLYVFMCPSMTCLLQDQHEQWNRPPKKALRSVKVFRCQLARDNPFYSSIPPRHDGTDKPTTDGASLCSWCGTWKGNKICSNCRRAHYCSERHQAFHWKSGHKNECLLSVPDKSLDSSPSSCLTETQTVASNTLWSEYEIIQDYEGDLDKSVCDTDGSSLLSASRMDETVDSLMDTFEGDSDKKSWASFQERIARDPEQVLRYCRHERAKPLWPMSSGRLSKADIPNCNYCGGPRDYEFQVLPQLLYYFGVKDDVNSLDWSTIVIYTCRASCDNDGEPYKEEFAWVQLASQSATVA